VTILIKILVALANTIFTNVGGFFCRCLLAKNFLRIGKWFVQPHDGSDTDTKW